MDSDSGAPPPPPPSPSARYAYLVARLRTRQITMNEATELFELQQSTLASALARAQTVQGSPTPPPPPSETPTPSTPSPTGVPALPGDDAFWMGLLAVGAGSGLLAAVLKRSREPGPSSPTGAARAGSGPTR